MPPPRERATMAMYASYRMEREGRNVIHDHRQRKRRVVSRGFAAVATAIVFAIGLFAACGFAQQPVSRLELVSILPAEGPPGAFVLNFKNTGTAPAISFRYGETVFSARAEVSAQELDALFARLHDSMRNAQTIAGEIGPDATTSYSAAAGAADDQSADLMYLVQIGFWKDAATAPGQWRAAEVCLFVDYRVRALHRCESHNRAMLIGD